MLSELSFFLMCKVTLPNCPNGTIFRRFALSEKIFGNIPLVLYKANINFRKTSIKKIYISLVSAKGFFVCYA